MDLKNSTKYEILIKANDETKILNYYFSDVGGTDNTVSKTISDVDAFNYFGLRLLNEANKLRLLLRKWEQDDLLK